MIVDPCAIVINQLLLKSCDSTGKPHAIRFLHLHRHVFCWC